MPINSTSPPPPPSIVNWLGSGSGTANGSGAAATIGTFSTTGALGNKTLIVEITTEKILGATTANIGLSATTNADGPLMETNNTLNANQLIIERFRQKASTTAETQWNHVVAAGSNVAMSDKLFALNTFDFSAAETLYLVYNAAVGQNIKYTWQAYVVG